MTDVVVDVRNLSKVYFPSPGWMKLLLRTSVKEPVVALDDLSLQVEKGQIFTVLGPNGAGKSTFFKVLTGLTTPTEGSASVLGFDATTQSTLVRKQIGYAPSGENRTLLLRFTCRENLAFHGRLQGIPEADLDKRIDETLELVGLADAGDRVGFALSSGMLARLILARALLHHPPVLILDEPTGTVDPVGSYHLLGLIQEIASERGLAVLLSSHRLDEVELLKGDVLLLDRGIVKYTGSLGGMRGKFEHPRVEITFDSQNSAARAATSLGSLPSVESVDRDGELVTLDSTVPIGQLLAMANGQIETIRSIVESRMSLQELLTRVLSEEGESDG